MPYCAQAMRMDVGRPVVIAVKDCRASDFSTCSCTAIEQRFV